MILRHRLCTILLTIAATLLLCTLQSKAQDSTSTSIADTIINLPLKYVNQIDNKIDKYNSRLISKTEKTLTKLSKWENKIKRLLQKVNPEAAERLFNNQTTFSTLLQKLQEGKSIAENYQVKYDEYRDNLRSSVSYLQQQKDALNTKVVQPLKEADQKLTNLEENVKNSEALQQFIKERKKQLIDQSIQYIGKSKYLAKISKESYYYIETLRNYKELFSDQKKAEQVALTLLNKIPAFTKFIQENSMLAQLFGSPNAPASAANLAGLQTRAGVNALIQNQIAAGGPNAQQVMQQNFQQAQTDLSKLKDKILKSGGSSSDAEIPPRGANGSKTKTFKQRLEFGTNIQTQKATNYFPVRSDLGLSVGYKLNDKSIIGIGASYSLGLGRGWNNIRISNQGFGFRSFIDWRLKKQFWLSGGYELNYKEKFQIVNGAVAPPLGGRGVQTSALFGLTKKINTKTKWFKGSSFQLLYDAMAYKQVPAGNPVVFRIGYNIK